MIHKYEKVRKSKEEKEKRKNIPTHKLRNRLNKTFLRPFLKSYANNKVIKKKKNNMSLRDVSIKTKISAQNIWNSDIFNIEQLKKINGCKNLDRRYRLKYY